MKNKNPLFVETCICTHPVEQYYEKLCLVFANAKLVFEWSLMFIDYPSPYAYLLCELAQHLCLSAHF